MFPIPGIPGKPDPEELIREIENDPLTRVTWWLMAETGRFGQTLRRWFSRSGTVGLPVQWTESELTFLKSQRLARIATVSADGQPDAIPVGFIFDGKAFYVGDAQIDQTIPNRVALVVDELRSQNPNEGRGIRIYGRAEVIKADGMIARCLRIIPQAIYSWGIDTVA